MFAGAVFFPSVCFGFFFYTMLLSLPCCHCLAPFICVPSWLWDDVNWRVECIQWPNDTPSLTRHSLLQVMSFQPSPHRPDCTRCPHTAPRDSYLTSQSIITHPLNTPRRSQVNSKQWVVMQLGFRVKLVYPNQRFEKLTLSSSFKKETKHQFYPNQFVFPKSTF